MYIFELISSIVCLWLRQHRCVRIIFLRGFTFLLLSPSFLGWHCIRLAFPFFLFTFGYFFLPNLQLILVTLNWYLWVLIKQTAVVSIKLEFTGSLLQQILHFLFLLDPFSIIIQLLPFHQQNINIPSSLSASPPSPLDRPNWWMPTIIADDAVNFTNVQSFLSNWSWN